MNINLIENTNTKNAIFPNPISHLLLFSHDLNLFNFVGKDRGTPVPLNSITKNCSWTYLLTLSVFETLIEFSSWKHHLSFKLQTFYIYELQHNLFWFWFLKTSESHACQILKFLTYGTPYSLDLWLLCILRHQGYICRSFEIF